jgi:hypothetical protein
MAINYYTTGNAAGMFYPGDTQGITQGSFEESPVTRFAIEGGISADPKAIWGGVALQLKMSGKGNNYVGPSVAKATTAAEISGFCVSQQMYHAVVNAQNTAPQVATNNGVHFARIGSRLRLAVKIDPTFAETLYGLDVSTIKASWDFTNQQLIAFAADEVPGKIVAVYPESFVLAYDAATDTVSWTKGAAAYLEL